MQMGGSRKQHEPAAGLYDVWHAEQREANARPTATAPWHEMALTHVGHLAGARVLEIGCGRGAFSEVLAEGGAILTAADVSPVCVEETRQRLGRYENITVDVVDIQRMPYPDATFDVVVSLETLEHVSDPDRGLAELVRVTRPGGKLIVSGPNYLSLVGLYRIYLWLRKRRYSELGQPINQPLVFAARVWKLRRLGCQILHTEGREHWLPVRRSARFERLPGVKWIALNTLTVARKRAGGGVT